MTRIERIDLLRAVVEPCRELREVAVQRIELPPGARGGLHTHPCPVVGLVVEGTVRYQIEGSEAELLAAGSAFYEPADRRILEFSNASMVEPAGFVAFYLGAGGEGPLVQMLER
jgi:hypothetical protein